MGKPENRSNPWLEGDRLSRRGAAVRIFAPGDAAQ
jgi:hypothetical protein